MGRPTRLIVLADTGPICALVNANDPAHDAVVDWWRNNREEILLPESVLPEITYLLQKWIGPSAETAFIRSIVDGEFDTVSLVPQDMPRIAAVMAEYEDLGLGFVDASIVAIAERLETRHILTLDRRHFAAVRPVHTRSFVLLPFQHQERLT